MSDDTRRILDLLAQGKITVDEADQLLRAVGGPAASGTSETAEEAVQPSARWVRIKVHKPKDGGREKDVNIRVPIAIIKSGMRLGALIPGLAGERVAARLRERGLDVDWSKLDAGTIDAILRDLGEANIEIDDGRAQVRITCE